MATRRRQNHFLIQCPFTKRQATFLTTPSPRSFFESIAWITWDRLKEAHMEIHRNEDLLKCDNCAEPSDGFMILVNRPRREATATLPKCVKCMRLWHIENEPKKYD